jgi:hypothetical protein
MTSIRSLPPSRLLLVLAAVAVSLFGLIVPASAAGPYCGITWGSLNKGSETGDSGYADEVRAGQHACYDRLVVDIFGSRHYGTWYAGYVPQLPAEPSGLPFALRGGAFIQLTLPVAPAVTPNGTLTYVPADDRELVDVTGFRTFRQVALSGSLESRVAGVTTIALGVRARLPFRVLTISGIPGTANGTRVVLDVAHHW